MPRISRRQQKAMFAGLRGKKYKQVGKSKMNADMKRTAMKAGWRIAKSSGKLYFENRKNRSDSKHGRHPNPYWV